MQLTIISPKEKKTYRVLWVEINTPSGNFVIQAGHAPTIVMISPGQPLLFCLENGKQETINPESGIVHVNRTHISLLMPE